MAAEKRQTCWRKLHVEAAEYESQLTTILPNRNKKQILVARLRKKSNEYMAWVSTQESSAIEQNSSSQDGIRKTGKEW